jgi:hypothetical protein
MERFFTLHQSPLYQKLRESLSNGSFGDIISASVDPMDYQNAEDFRRDYLAAEIFSKFDSFDLGIDRSSVAIEKALDCEYTMYWVNRSLPHLRGDVNSRLTPHSVLFTAARKISKVLGSFDLDECIQLANWGPGATVSLPRTKGDAYYKLENQGNTASPLMRPYIEALDKFWPDIPVTVTYVPGSRMITVPKSAKTDRVIAIEPDWNMFFQKGVGAMIRSRLSRCTGLLRSDAQERNQNLARLASIEGSTLATVDLSSASDSISLELVCQLLPADWFSHLFNMRSPCFQLDGKWYQNEKFSSMGNGYTFELETLLFWGLSAAIVDLVQPLDRTVSVYGDDIIISSETRDLLEETFSSVGFTVNKKKSFFEGPFRESCGKHFFRGSDVSPIYLRTPLRTVFDAYSCLNNIRRISTLPYGLDPFLKPIYDWLLDLIPQRYKLYVPSSLPSDSGIHADFDQVLPNIKVKRGGSEVRFRVPYFRFFRRPNEKTSWGILKKSLFILEHGSEYPEFGVNPLSISGRYVLSYTTVRRWDCSGPFLE